jgi:hypothetical protein
MLCITIRTEARLNGNVGSAMQRHHGHLPMVLCPMVLCPVILCPMVLCPVVLCPVVLCPMVLCPMVLCRMDLMVQSDFTGTLKKY